tara:strand:+ start:85 stop:1458 length:1374 start_codon:yes stop_codon:yes gene_type:complete
MAFERFEVHENTTRRNTFVKMKRAFEKAGVPWPIALERVKKYGSTAGRVAAEIELEKLAANDEEDEDSGEVIDLTEIDIAAAAADAAANASIGDDEKDAFIRELEENLRATVDGEASAVATSVPLPEAADFVVDSVGLGSVTVYPPPAPASSSSAAASSSTPTALAPKVTLHLLCGSKQLYFKCSHESKANGSASKLILPIGRSNSTVIHYNEVRTPAVSHFHDGQTMTVRLSLLLVSTPLFAVNAFKMGKSGLLGRQSWDTQDSVPPQFVSDAKGALQLNVKLTLESAADLKAWEAALSNATVHTGMISAEHRRSATLLQRFPLASFGTAMSDATLTAIIALQKKRAEAALAASHLPLFDDTDYVEMMLEIWLARLKSWRDDVPYRWDVFPPRPAVASDSLSSVRVYRFWQMCGCDQLRYIDAQGDPRLVSGGKLHSFCSAWKRSATMNSSTGVRV